MATAMCPMCSLPIRECSCPWVIPNTSSDIGSVTETANIASQLPPMPPEVRRLVEAVDKLESLDAMYGINIDTGTLYDSAAAVRRIYRSEP